MRKLTITLFLSLSLFFNASADNLMQIKKRMIEESIESYSGNCPCPYNVARNGSSCGGRSAYSRKGGYAPLCYVSDISDKQARDWKKNRN
jgi:hypothetical protein